MTNEASDALFMVFYRGETAIRSHGPGLVRCITRRTVPGSLIDRAPIVRLHLGAALLGARSL